MGVLVTAELVVEVLLSVAIPLTTQGVVIFPDLDKIFTAVGWQSELQVEIPMGKQRGCWFQCQSL